jgi:hypothetical protein
MNDFIPSDYKIPVTSNYLKITEGEHIFRALSSAIVGYEYFNKENKPVRSETPFEDTPEDMKLGSKINPFWAFIIWNYDLKRIQILNLTQKTIMQPLQALIRNPKWGNPKNYDITITRKGTGMNDTEYAVIPNPHSPVDENVAAELAKKNIDLTLLYQGADPFATKNG